MLRKTIATSLSTAVLLAAGAAAAQPAPGGATVTSTPDTRSSFGERGQLIIGAEHLVTLFAFESSKAVDTSTQGQTVTVTASQTSMSFFGSNPGGPGGGLTTFYKIPRLGFDYVLIPNLTVGGSVMLLFTLGSGQSIKTDANGQSTTTSFDGSALTLFGLAPRVGYVIALNESFAIWPRGGFSYYSTSVREAAVVDPRGTTVVTNTINQWALDAEGLLVFTPFAHVGVTAGLALDIPLTGSLKRDSTTGPVTNTNTQDSTLWHLGLNIGAVVYF